MLISNPSHRVSDLPLSDDVIRVLSMFKECGVQSNHLLSRIDNLASQTSLHEVSNNELLKELESLLVELQDVNDEKVALAVKLNECASKKIESFSYNKDRDITTPHHSGELSSTLRLKNFPATQTRGKRRRKSKRILFQDITPIAMKAKRNEVEKQENVEKKNNLVDLLMLAEVATKKDQISVKPSGYGKTQNRLRRMVKPPVKRQVQVEAKVETEESETEDDEDHDDSKSGVDENEPLYCICNKVSYGDMVECGNEGCSIEWCHFECVGLRRAPKGKW